MSAVAFHSPIGVAFWTRSTTSGTHVADQRTGPIARAVCSKSSNDLLVCASGQKGQIRSMHLHLRHAACRTRGRRHGSSTGSKQNQSEV